MNPHPDARDRGSASASTSRRPGVVNALTAVEVLAAGGGEMGLVQLSRALGLDAAHVRRIMQQLMAEGWVSQSGDAASYRFGARMLTLSGQILGNLDLSHAAQPIMQALREASGETVHLGVLREDSVVCVARELSRHSVVAVATAVGDVWPVFGSAMGAAVRSAMLGAQDLASDSEAAEARARGFSIDYGRHKNGITGLAAPVFGYRGAPEGAVAVSGPEDRMSADRIDEVGVLVVRAAADLSAAMGYASSAEAAE